MTTFRKIKHKGYKKMSDHVFEVVIYMVAIVALLFWFAFFLNIGDTVQVGVEWAPTLKSLMMAIIFTLVALLLNRLYGGEEAWNRPTYKKYIRDLRKVAGKKENKPE